MRATEGTDCLKNSRTAVSSSRRRCGFSLIYHRKKRTLLFPPSAGSRPSSTMACIQILVPDRRRYATTLRQYSFTSTTSPAQDPRPFFSDKRSLSTGRINLLGPHQLPLIHKSLKKRKRSRGERSPLVQSLLAQAAEHGISSIKNPPVPVSKRSRLHVRSHGSLEIALLAAVANAMRELRVHETDDGDGG